MSRNKGFIICLILVLLPGALRSIPDAGEDLKEKLKSSEGTERIDLLLELTRKNMGSAPDKSLEYARESLQLAKKANSPKDIFRSLKEIGSCFFVKNQYREAITYYLDAYKLEPQIENENMIAGLLANTGAVYWKLEDYERSEQYLRKALEIRRRIYAPKAGMANLLNNLGLVLKGKKDYDKAMIKENEIQLLNKKNRVERRLRFLLLTAGALFLFIGLLVYLRIHSQKKANRMLQASEAKYRSLFTRAGDAIFLLDDGKVADCNRQAPQMLGIGRDHILGRDLCQLSPPAQQDKRDSAEVCAEKNAKTLNGEPQRFYWQFNKKGGHNHDDSPIDTMVSMTAVTIGDKPMVQAMTHDISARKRLEEERIKTAKLETANLLADGITHDVNNLFTVFLWKLEDAMELAQSNKEVSAPLVKVHNAVDSAMALSKQFLALSADIRKKGGLSLEKIKGQRKT